MSILFQSEPIVHSDESVHSVENVVIDESNRRITFEFTKNGIAFIPQSAEYSFSTKVFSVTPQAGQLQSGDQIVMNILSLSI